VETQAQREFLQQHNCDYAQGYYFSKPLSVTELEDYLDRHFNLNLASHE